MNGCIEFQGYIGNHGYGKVTYKGEEWLAHRLSYAKAHGLSKAQMKNICVLHRCDNRPCTNPEHLFSGTKGDNARDRNEKGRTTRGEQCYNAKLTEKTVREIRSAASLPGANQHEIAKKYGVSNKTISKVVTGVRWSHISP